MLQVVKMDMMTADGKIIDVNRESDPDLFRAAVVSFGSMGVILNITLQCEPMFNLELTKTPVKFKDVSTPFCFSPAFTAGK